MPTPIKSDAEKLRFIVKTIKESSPHVGYNFITDSRIQYDILNAADNYERLKNKIFKLENEDIQNRVSIAVAEAEEEMEKWYKAKINRLSIALHNIINATEDKNGQFRAWHQHLRETTYNGKQVLNEQDQRNTTSTQ